MADNVITRRVWRNDSTPALDQVNLGSLEDDLASVNTQANLALNVAAGPANAVRVLAPDGLPAYAKNIGLTGRFDPVRSLYGLTGSNLRNYRRARGVALLGSGFIDLVWLGDSLLIGWNGATYSAPAALPRQVAAGLSRITGLPIVGGIVPAVAGGSTSNPSSPLWTPAGSTDIGQFFPGIALLATGASDTFAPPDPGPTVWVFYLDNGAGFTVSVDGATSGAGFATVVTGGSNQLLMTTLTGLANTTHSVKITATGNYTNLIAAAVTGSSSFGIRTHNLGLGGTTAAYGGAATNWNDTTNSFYGFSATRRACLTAAGITPSLVATSIGNNDIFFGQTTVAQIVAGATAMRAFYPNADQLRIQGYTESTTANVTAYLQAMYQLADTLAIPMVDWQYLIGDRATAQLAGDLGPDNFHPTFAAQAALGSGVGDLLAA